MESTPEQKTITIEEGGNERKSQQRKTSLEDEPNEDGLDIQLLQWKMTMTQTALKEYNFN